MWKIEFNKRKIHFFKKKVEKILQLKKMCLLLLRNKIDKVSFGNDFISLNTQFWLIFVENTHVFYL